MRGNREHKSGLSQVHRPAKKIRLGIGNESEVRENADTEEFEVFESLSFLMWDFSVV